MAIRRVCDRCGKVINPSSSATYVKIHRSPDDGEPIRYELCCSCGMWLRRYLGGEEIVLAQEGGDGNG